MGWRSTMRITENDARKEMLNRIFEAKPVDLERWMDIVFNDSSYKFDIVWNYEAGSNDRLQYDVFKAEGGTL